MTALLFRWYRWKMEHKRGYDLFRVCLLVMVALLLLLPVLLQLTNRALLSTDRSSGRVEWIDSVRFMPDHNSR